MEPIILLAALVAIILVIAVSCLKIVPQAQAYVIERLGAYQGTWSVGFHIKVPFVDKVARRVNLKEQVADFPPQPVITKDNVTMRIATGISYVVCSAMHRQLHPRYPSDSSCSVVAL